jgi:RNA polymerase sigma-70 factor (ECF subfamily)
VPLEEREDAAQDVFVAIYRGLKSFRGEAQLSTWIYRIAARHASHLGRRRRMRSFLSLLPWQEAEPEPEPQPDPAEKASELRLLDRLLAKLSPKKRMVLVLFEIEGLGVNEIAQVMGCPPNTVWSRLRHARAELVRAARRITR